MLAAKLSACCIYYFIYYGHACITHHPYASLSIHILTLYEIMSRAKDRWQYAVVKLRVDAGFGCHSVPMPRCLGFSEDRALFLENALWRIERQ
jgi:hypothetical protein